VLFVAVTIGAVAFFLFFGFVYYACVRAFCCSCGCLLSAIALVALGGAFAPAIVVEFVVAVGRRCCRCCSHSCKESRMHRCTGSCFCCGCCRGCSCRCLFVVVVCVGFGVVFCFLLWLLSSFRYRWCFCFSGVVLIVVAFVT